MVKNINKRTLLVLLGSIWLIFVVGFMFNYDNTQSGLSSIYDDEILNPGTTVQNNHHHDNVPIKLDVKKNKFLQSLSAGLNINDVRTIDSHSSIYDYIFENHDLNAVINDLSFKDRCDLYFKNLYLHDNNWFIDPNENLPVHHKGQFKFDDYRNSERKRIKHDLAKEKQVDEGTIPDDDPELQEKIKLDYEGFWKETMELEQKMTDSLSHLRIFNKCYITADDSLQTESINSLIKQEKSGLKDTAHTFGKFSYTEDEQLINTKSFGSCNEVESRIYRWLSFSYPIYERWTGDVHLSPPDMKKFVDYPEVFQPSNPKLKGKIGKKIESHMTNNKPCFLNSFKNLLNGKGIVFTIGEQHVDDTVRLMHLLRALNNHYPIQIVYYDDLSAESKKRIVNAARNRMTDIPQSFEKVKHMFPDDYIKGDGLPKQEVWFVNTYNAIHQNYQQKFKSYSNKFLTALFNSFEEYMLIDADTVLLENPTYFFNLAKYVKTGAFFYKDRSAAENRPESDCKFFEKITPSLIDNVMFDIPIITQHTLGRYFFQGLNHYMESGLVLTNHRLHFNSILAMIQMNFFKAVQDRSFGDKELFWLSFAVNGDEGYEFNFYFAGAIGDITPKDERLTGSGEKKVSDEVCASHPGHISDQDNNLVWFNSGFKFCAHSDNINYEEEVKRQGRFKTITEADELRRLYENPITLKAAIIPPFIGPQQFSFDNAFEEPKQGWHHDSFYCKRHLWCAYSSIGGKNNNGDDSTIQGKVFQFDTESTDLFQYYGDVWVGNE